MKQRNLEVDTLRAFAIGMTIYMHYIRLFLPWKLIPIYQQYQHGTTVGHIWSNCWTGVDLFLVISGYVISKTIVTGIDSLKQSGGLALFIKSFYVRRIYRIYPLAWLMFFFVLCMSIFFNSTHIFSTPENNVEAGISIFTYTNNYYFAYGLYHSFALGQYWSLSLEEQFYLFLPLFLVFTNTTKQRVLILTAILLIVTFIIRPFTHGTYMFLYTQTRCDALIYGCLIYYLTEQEWFSAIKVTVNKSNKLFWNAMALLLILVLAAIPGIGFSNNLIIPLAALTASLLVIAASFNVGILIFPKPIQVILNYLGKRSYAIYIVHFPVFAFTQELFYRLVKTNTLSIQHVTLKYSVFTLVLIFIITEILHRYIEIPLMEKGRLISKEINEKTRLHETTIKINDRRNYSLNY